VDKILIDQCPLADKAKAVAGLTDDATEQHLPYIPPPLLHLLKVFNQVLYDE
jgi:hypothetical protein